MQAWVGAQQSPSRGGASGVACHISTLRAVPVGDQGLLPTQHTVCRAVGPKKGQPHGLAFTQYFLLILNKFFCCIFFCFYF